MTRKATALFLSVVFLTTFCSINILSTFASDVDSWIIKTPMPTPRKDLGVAVVDGKIYAIGGNNGSSANGTGERYE